MDKKQIYNLNTQMVSLENINLNIGPYTMSFDFDSWLLMESIKRVGLINCPILIKEDKPAFTIITGFRRINALNALDMTSIPCRILPENCFKPLDCLLLNLYENLAVRELNDIEKGMILLRLSHFFSDKEILEDYMPMIGLPSNKKDLELYKALVEILEKDIKKALVQQRLTLQTAKLLLKLHPEARQAICKLLLKLNLSLNNQKQLIDILHDISLNEDITISDIIDNPDIIRIYLDANLNVPQKGRAVLAYLRSRHYPILTKAETAFKKNIAQLKLPKGSTLSAPQYFEASNFRLEILFEDGNDLTEKLARLSALKALQNLKSPIEGLL